MKIVAAVAHPGSQQFEIEDLELREPRADEVVVKIAAVGVCHTDLVFRDFAPFGRDAVLGHEGAGTVERVGADVTKVKPGDRVALTFSSCGSCRWCVRHHPANCVNFTALNYAGARPDGETVIHRSGLAIASHFFGQSSFASRAVTSERNIVRLADDVPFELAAPLGCGFQTGVGSVLRSLDCPAASSLVIAGGGAVGLSAIMAAKHRGCAAIVLVEPLPARRALALELGATHVIDPALATDLRGALAEIEPSGFEFALDTSGRPDTLQTLLSSLGSRGVLGCVGVGPMEAGLPGNLNAFLTAGQSVLGIVEGDSDPDVFIPEMIDKWRDGRLPLDRLIQTYPFDRINEAIADQKAGLCVKVVLTFG